MFKYLLNRSAREGAKSHWLHLFDFSRLCVFKCACDAADVGGGWPQQQRADAQRGAVLRARTQQPSMQLQPKESLENIQLPHPAFIAFAFYVAIDLDKF